VTVGLDAIPLARPTRLAVDAATAGCAILGVALIIGLVTARHYGMTVDEFNTDDYGPKALAWYTSGFTDRAHFEAVEPFLWYYGPWAQVLIAAVQSLGLADPLTVRHAVTFVIGLAGLAALLPLARLTVGRWAGPVALVLCLITGNLYGSLFFTPIDVPFLAAMCWATLAIVAMARRPVPTWRTTLLAGGALGLAVATRPGGILAHGYLIGAMALAATEVVLTYGRAARSYVVTIAVRTAAALATAWVTAIALWPWLQVGNPLAQFRTAFVHFGKIPMAMEFPHWGEILNTNALPWSYLPGQWLARLPEAFLVLLAFALLSALAIAVRFAAAAVARFRQQGAEGLRTPALLVARARGTLVIWAATLVPVGYIMMRQATLYDGIRHTLFVIPMLALLAGWAALRLLPALRRAAVPAAIATAAYLVAVIANLVVLHPLEYIATNAFAGGTRGSYGRFEQDYWSAAATEALRRLEQRLDADGAFAGEPPSVLICIGHREGMTKPLLRKPWRLELDVTKADFVIETERWACAANARDLVLIDQVMRNDRGFAWTYARRNDR
jgi:hypothetical protein